MKDPFKTFWPSELCTWQYAPGVCRFQTTEPRFARKLAKRRNARLVAWSVTPRYLRIFEEPIAPWRARDLVTRYMHANEAFSDPTAVPIPAKSASKVPVAASNPGDA